MSQLYGKLDIFVRKRDLFETEDEVAFINGLGKWIPKGADAPRTPRKQLLQRYRDASKQRADWGTIDPVVVSEELNRLLNV